MKRPRQGDVRVRRLDDTQYLNATMFDAALGTAEFVDVLALVNNHFGAGDGILFELNRKFGTIERFVAPGLVQETRAKDYLQHLNSINPRMKTKAVRDGDDWLISGTKHFISNAQLAAFAVVFVATGEEETSKGTKKRISAFLVDMKSAGCCHRAA